LIIIDDSTSKQSIGEWPPFPDTSEALKYLSQHYKLVALSNIDRSSFSKSEALVSESLREKEKSREQGREL